MEMGKGERRIRDLINSSHSKIHQSFRLRIQSPQLTVRLPRTRDLGLRFCSSNCLRASMGSGYMMEDTGRTTWCWHTVGKREVISG